MPLVPPACKSPERGSPTYFVNQLVKASGTIIEFELGSVSLFWEINFKYNKTCC